MPGTHERTKSDPNPLHMEGTIHIPGEATPTSPETIKSDESKAKALAMEARWREERDRMGKLAKSRGLTFVTARKSEGAIAGFDDFMKIHTQRVNLLKKLREECRELTPADESALTALDQICDTAMKTALGEREKPEVLLGILTSLAAQYTTLSEKTAELKQNSKNPVALYLNLEKPDSKDRTHASIAAESKAIIDRGTQDPTTITRADINKLQTNIAALKRRVESSVGKIWDDPRYTAESQKLDALTKEQLASTTLTKEGAPTTEKGITELKIAYRKADQEYKAALRAKYEGNALGMDIARGGRAIDRAFGFDPTLGEPVSSKKALFDEARKNYLVYFENKLKGRYATPDGNEVVSGHQGTMAERYILEPHKMALAIEKGGLPDSKKSLLDQISSKLSVIPKPARVAFALGVVGASSFATAGAAPLVALVAGIGVREGIKYMRRGTEARAAENLATVEENTVSSFSAANIDVFTKQLEDATKKNEAVRARTQVLSRVGGMAAAAGAGFAAHHTDLLNNFPSPTEAHAAVPTSEINASQIDTSSAVGTHSPDTTNIDIHTGNEGTDVSADVEVPNNSSPDAFEEGIDTESAPNFVYHIPETGPAGSHAWDAVEAYLREKHPDLNFRTQEEITKYFFDKYLPNNPDVAMDMGLKSSGANFMVDPGQDVIFGKFPAGWLDTASEHVRAGNGMVEVADDGSIPDAIVKEVWNPPTEHTETSPDLSTDTPTAPDASVQESVKQDFQQPSPDTVVTEPGKQDFMQKTPDVAPDAPRRIFVQPGDTDVPAEVLPTPAPALEPIPVPDTTTLPRTTGIDTPPIERAPLPPLTPRTEAVPQPAELVATAAAVSLVGLTPEQQKKVDAQTRETILQLEKSLEGRNGKRFKSLALFTSPTTLDKIYDWPQKNFEALSTLGSNGNSALEDMKIDPQYFKKWYDYFNIFLRSKGFTPDQNLTVGQNLEKVVSESIRKTVT